MTRGRPPYRPSPEHLATAQLGAKRGHSEKEIASAIGISLSTFYKNKKAFTEVLKKGHAQSDDQFLERAEDSLRKKIEGYEYVEKHRDVKETPFRVTVKDEDGKYLKDADGNYVYDVEFKKTVHLKEVTKWIVPDSMLIIWYLVNRNSGRWQSINHIEPDQADTPDPDRWGKFMDEMTLGE
jgi:transposase